MSKVSIISLDKARTVKPPSACSSSGEVRAYWDDVRNPLHLHLYEIAAGRPLHFEQSDVDRVAYVWRGNVIAGTHVLGEGSSAIVEHGRLLTIQGEAAISQILVFAVADASHQSRVGGHIHLLPVAHVPRTLAPDTGSYAARGGIHANSECPTCQVWLHENSFPGVSTVSKDEEKLGIHSHTEDEIIFVTDGQIRLGRRLHGPGTALAIAANTLYSFTAGPEGLRFINFRSGLPGDIRFGNGGSMSEVGYWRDRVSSPQYIEG